MPIDSTHVRWELRPGLLHVVHLDVINRIERLHLVVVVERTNYFIAVPIVVKDLVQAICVHCADLATA